MCAAEARPHKRKPSRQLVCGDRLGVGVSGARGQRCSGPRTAGSVGEHVTRSVRTCPRGRKTGREKQDGRDACAAAALRLVVTFPRISGQKRKRGQAAPELGRAPTAKQRGGRRAGPQPGEATSACSLVTALTGQVTSTGGFCVLLPQDRMASLRSHAGHSVGEDDRDTTGCGHICFPSRQASAPPKGRDQRVLTGVARPRPPRQAPRAPQQLRATPPADTLAEVAVWAPGARIRLLTRPGRKGRPAWAVDGGR